MPLLENEAVSYSKYWTCVKKKKNKPKDKKPCSNISSHSVYHMLRPKLKIILNVLFRDQWRSSENTQTRVLFSYITEVSFVIHRLSAFWCELLFTCKETLFGFHNLPDLYKRRVSLFNFGSAIVEHTFCFVSFSFPPWGRHYYFPKH